MLDFKRVNGNRYVGKQVIPLSWNVLPSSFRKLLFIDHDLDQMSPPPGSIP